MHEEHIKFTMYLDSLIYELSGNEGKLSNVIHIMLMDSGHLAKCSMEGDIVPPLHVASGNIIQRLVDISPAVTLHINVSFP